MNTDQTTVELAPSGFLSGDGEMIRLTREFPWEKTSIGPEDQWPQSLRTVLDAMLHSGFPMFLFWGPDLICFYNDSFRPSLGQDGKHPAIGKKGKEVWSEIREFIGPLITQVMTTGIPLWFEDQLVPFYRNGKIEDIYWTFSYSQVHNEKNEPAGVLVICTETTGKVNTLVNLKDSMDELAFAIDATELGTWDYNPQTGLFKANDRLKEWFGINAGEEVDLQLALEAIIDKDRERVTLAINQALQYDSGGQYDIEYTIVSKQTGQKRMVRAKGRARFSENKEAIRLNGTLQDVTDQVIARNVQKETGKQLEELVAQRTAELARSNEDLERFAHVASHDLKEPARKIRLFAGRLREEMVDILPERGKHYLDKVQVSAERMLKMIEGVLAYSSSDLTLELNQPVNLQTVISDIKTDLDMLFHQKRAQLLFEDLPVIEGAAVLIYQLFYNLINNSLKFARETAPEIQISSVLLELAGKEYVRVLVKDNGIGFKQEQAQRIFESFARLHPKDKYEGTGLGLSLCKKIVERHHGTILAYGDPGQGAVFEIMLPVRQEKEL